MIVMDKMRTILTQLMEREGHNACDVERKSGVRQSTTFRFLKGLIKDPSSETVRKWARLYGMTESQFRGDAPIHGINVPEEPKELRDILPEDEYKLLKKIKNLNPEARGVVIGLFDLLDKKSDAANSCSSGTDRRRSVVSEKNQHLRAGELHYSPPHQNHLKEQEIATRTGTRA